jgi:hypothetical protein
MTYRLGGPVFSSIALSLVLGVVTAGCASREPAAVGQAGARNTGTFPNLNVPPKTAAEQLSSEQTSADTAALKAAGEANAAQATSPSGQTDPATLRKLGATHAEEALKAIEQ